MVNRFTAVTAAMLVAASAAMAQNQPEKKSKKDQPSKQREKAPSTLSVGDKAPGLSVEQFVKGNKVTQFEPGKVYVVEFWATWCGPCIANIPHLTQIQKEFKDKGVTVIGVAASENGSGGDVLVKLKKFVQQKGDEMSYTVAYDADRSMARTWMEPASVRGIPHAFVVGKDGKVAWHGHPGGDEMEKEIKKALAAKGPAPKGEKNDKGGSAGGSSGSGLLVLPEGHHGPFDGGLAEGCQGSRAGILPISQPEKTDKPAKAKREKKAEKAEPGAVLFVGDKAPEIAVAKWVKGEPVTGFEKGKTYVVEFWATWCGPCRKSIPHLTELQSDYKDKVKFVGVSVWETDQDAVEPFVKEQGDEMGYTVAMDEIPEDGDRNDGKMAQNWLAAAGQRSIPVAFIVNGDGKIAWIGHPNDRDSTMEHVLDKVVTGKWDLEKARRASERDAAFARYQAARNGGDLSRELAAIDQVIALDPTAVDERQGKEPLVGRKFVILLKEQKESEKAYAYGRAIVDGAGRDNPMALNEIAWTIVDPEALPEKQDLELALKAAQRAHELTNESDPAITDTLAKVYHDKGDMTKALELQEKAAELAKGTPFEKEIADRLAQFKKEAKKAK